MPACLQIVRGLLDINMMNLVVKILMQDMTILEMVVVVVGRLVNMAKMDDELMGVVVTIMCVLMMKSLMTMLKKRGLLRIPLQMMGCMGSTMIIGGVLIMESIIVVVVIGKT